MAANCAADLCKDSVAVYQELPITVASIRQKKVAINVNTSDQSLQSSDSKEMPLVLHDTGSSVSADTSVRISGPRGRPPKSSSTGVTSSVESQQNSSSARKTTKSTVKRKLVVSENISMVTDIEQQPKKAPSKKLPVRRNTSGSSIDESLKPTLSSSSTRSGSSTLTDNSTLNVTKKSGSASGKYVQLHPAIFQQLSVV